MEILFEWDERTRLMKLRKITEDDTDNIIKWRNSEDVLKYFLDKRPLTAERHNEWYQNMILTGKVHQFIIVLDDEREIGSVYLKNIDTVNSNAEFGIFIGEKCEKGKGYGTMATRLICDYAFRTLHLHKVYLRLLSDNQRAEKCYEKAGFVREGVFVDNIWDGDKFINVTFMAIFNKKS